MSSLSFSPLAGGTRKPFITPQPLSEEEHQGEPWAGSLWEGEEEDCVWRLRPIAELLWLQTSQGKDNTWDIFFSLSIKNTENWCLGDLRAQSSSRLLPSTFICLEEL